MRKKKLLLASAVFAAGIFAASCGGGDGGTLLTDDKEGSPGGGTDVTTVAKVLLRLVYPTAAGTVNIAPGMYEMQVNSDGTYIATPVTDPNNGTVNYTTLHVFANGNLLLSDAAFTNLYLYDKNAKQIKVINYKNAAGNTVQLPAAITSALPQYSIVTGVGTFVFVKADGSVIDRLGGNTIAATISVNPNYAVLSDGTDHYIVKPDGTSTKIVAGSYKPTEAGAGLALLPDSDADTNPELALVQSDGTVIAVKNTSNAPINVTGGWGTFPAATAQYARVDVGGKTYVAFQDSAGVLWYYEISGSVATSVKLDMTASGAPNYSNGANVIDYGLDPNGNLFIAFDKNGTINDGDEEIAMITPNGAAVRSADLTLPATVLSYIGTEMAKVDAVANIFYRSGTALSSNATTAVFPSATDTNDLGDVFVRKGNEFLFINADNTGDTYTTQEARYIVLSTDPTQIVSVASALGTNNSLVAMGSYVYDTDNTTLGTNLTYCDFGNPPCKTLNNVTDNDILNALLWDDVGILLGPIFSATDAAGNNVYQIDLLADTKTQLNRDSLGGTADGSVVNFRTASNKSAYGFLRILDDPAACPGFPRLKVIPDPADPAKDVEINFLQAENLCVGDIAGLVE